MGPSNLISPGVKRDKPSPGRLAVVRALRNKRDEVQLTKVVGALAAVDSDFARGFAQALIDRAAEDCPGHRAARYALGAVPEHLAACGERTLVDTERLRLSRIDLIFEAADDPNAFTLLVENKLDAPFQPDQLPKYLKRANDINAMGGRAGVIAVTRDFPTTGEPPEGEPAYLGSVRWGRLFEHLRGLEFDPAAREQWRCFLDVLDEQGDLGMTKLDANSVRGWAHYRRGRGMLVQLLNQIASRTLDHTRQELQKQFGEHYPPHVTDQLADLRFRGRVDQQWGDGLAFVVSMPPDSDAGFYVFAFAEHERVFFGIAVLPREPSTESAEALDGHGFKHDLDSGWHLTHDAEDEGVLTADDPALELADLIKRDITKLVTSGFLARELNERAAQLM